jgi:hypothetical protein
MIATRTDTVGDADHSTLFRKAGPTKEIASSDSATISVPMIALEIPLELMFLPWASDSSCVNLTGPVAEVQGTSLYAKIHSRVST